MIANPCMELGSEDQQCRCTDDGLVHIIVFFGNNEWLRNCDLAFLKVEQVDTAEERILTCLWCALERSDRCNDNTWI